MRLISAPIAGTARRLGVVIAALAMALVAVPLVHATAAPGLETEDLTGALTPDALVDTLLRGGVAASNVTYTGADEAAGTFSGGAEILGLESGIVLSSGNIADVIGPNSADQVSTDFFLEGDPDLDELAGMGFDTFDAAVLEFDFVPSAATLTFDYVFASEEYNEFVNSEFNDVFGFFVNGENCATVGAEDAPVSINTINNGNPFDTEPNSHPELYINNDLDDGGGAIDTEMDGLTVVLTCEASVNPGVTNHIKLAIADTSDGILDAAVFLGAETFVAAPDEFNFSASLTGSAEVPSVSTDGAGVFGGSYNPGQGAVTFNVITFNLEDITAAHIHCAPAGENGPVGVTLFSGPATDKDGILVQSSFSGPDDGNGCTWDGLGDVLEAMRSGNAYVNVHTTAHPSGEVRGQIVPAAIPPPGAGTFTDEDENIHEGNIEAIAAPGITKGCNPPDNDEYCPDDAITRGQMAAFLRRAFNLPAATEDFFTDDEASIFEGDINAVAAVGISKGCNPPDNDLFCPDDSVTREQMASFITRALGLTSGKGDDLFVDDDGSIHEPDIDALATAGITLGCNPPANDRFCPTDVVRRDQMGSFFARMLNLREMLPF